MTRKISLIAICIFFSSLLIGQTDPSILILSPYKIILDKELRNEVKNYKSADYFYENVSVSMASKVKSIYKLYEDIKVNPVKLKSKNSLESLAMIADTSNTRFIVNFSELNAFYQDSSIKVKIWIQLYDRFYKKIVIDKVYSENIETPQFFITKGAVKLGYSSTTTLLESGFDCSENTFDCNILKALNQPLKEICDTLINNNPQVFKEKELAIKREKILSSFDLSMNTEEVRLIFENNSKDSSLKKFFFKGFLNNNKTKFLAFFAGKCYYYDGYKADNIQSKLGICVNVMAGYKSDSIWNFNHANHVNYPTLNLDSVKNVSLFNLKNWGYFKNGSTDLDPLFWESSVFEEKVKYTESEKYGFAVRNQIEYNKQNNIRLFSGEGNISVGAQLLSPFMDILKRDNPIEFSGYIISSLSTYIYRLSNDWSVILSPVIVENKQGINTKKYFVVIPEVKEFFEWTYIEPVILKNVVAKTKLMKFFDQELKDLIDHLGTKKFWEEYVLKKDGNNYIYLRKRN